MPHIRKARKEDAKAINALSAGLGYEVVPDETAMERITAVLSSENNDIRVYESKEGILGWIHVFMSFKVASPPFAEIGGLVVSPDHRRRGVGRKLVKQAMKFAASKGVKLRVRCNAERTDAHRFYQSLDFSQNKTQFVFEIQTP